MKTLADKLKKYFETTPREEIERLWKKTEKFDHINSPKVEEYLKIKKK